MFYNLIANLIKWLQSKYKLEFFVSIMFGLCYLFLIASGYILIVVLIWRAIFWLLNS
jgi:hypothetical protein